MRAAFLLRPLSDLADLLWPRRCAACDGDLDDGQVFCGPCGGTLDALDPKCCCPRCAAPLPDRGGCVDCRRLGPVFDGARAGFGYGGPLSRALHRLKWEDRDDLAAPLGGLIGGALRELAPRCDAIAPVPLHRARLAQRGYNQAELLARAARRAAAVQLPILGNLLKRHGAAPATRRLGWAARQAQAAGAFTAARGAAGLRLLLVDDVMTTGATAQACTMALKKAGAVRVEVLTLCRTIP